MPRPGEAATYNMRVRAGTDWKRTFKCQGPDDLSPWLDLTGYTGTLKVAVRAGVTPILSKTSADAELTLDDVEQTVTVEIKAATTTAWETADFFAGQWQVDLLPAGDADQAFAFIKGSVIVDRSL